MTSDATISIEGKGGATASATLVRSEDSADTAVLLLKEERLAGLVEPLTAAGHHVLTLRALPGEDRLAIAAMESACEWLQGEFELEHLFAVGAGDGGTRAFLLGCMSSLPDAVVNVEGPLALPELSRERPFQPLEMALNLSCPLLALYAEEGTSVSAEDRAYSGEVLSQFARTFDIVTRTGNGLAPLDAAAHDRILEFLQEARE